MKTIAEHLEIFQGDLYDNRKPWGADPNKAANVVRQKYEWQFSRMNKLSQVKATLRAGSVTSLGAYPLYLITSDGAPLCFDCARKEFRQIVWDYLNQCSTGWKVVACEVNYEDNELHCDHCSKQIPSAYGDDKE